MCNIPIFLSSDNNYAPFVATTIASICDNTHFYCEFYILDGGITKENQDKICELKKLFSNFSIEFVKVSLQEIFKNIEYKNDCTYVTISTYNRFLIPKIKPEIKKAIYLDVDIILNGDISELFEVDIKDYYIAACKDDGSDLGYLNQNKLKLGINKESVYFNAGVLLINSEKWLEDNITEKLFQILKDKAEILSMADQDVLNIFFENTYYRLSQKFNQMISGADCLIHHFAGGIKPWQADFYIDNITKKPLKTEDLDLFWKYAKMTSFYDTITSIKEKFLRTHLLYNRYNKLVNKD